MIYAFKFRTVVKNDKRRQLLIATEIIFETFSFDSLCREKVIISNTFAFDLPWKPSSIVVIGEAACRAAQSN